MSSIMSSYEKMKALVSLREWHANLSAVIEAVGSDDFVERLVHALSTVAVIQSTQFVLEIQSRAPVLLYESGIPQQKYESLINRYFAAGYMLDPMCLAVKSGIVQGFYHLSEACPDDFFSSEYYKNYYLGNGVKEDCFYVIDLDPVTKLTLCFFQGKTGETFDYLQLEFLRSVEPLVRSLVLLHWQGQPAILSEQQGPCEAFDVQEQGISRDHISEAFKPFGNGALTEREKDVAHLILCGHSTKSAANTLKVGLETIRMHRKNLYAKLQINTQAELFALFLKSFATR